MNTSFKFKICELTVALIIIILSHTLS